MAKITPMMQQYFEIKEQYKHCLLFFRLGIYECFSRCDGPPKSWKCHSEKRLRAREETVYACL